MNTKKSAVATVLLIVAVVLSFAVGFYLGQTGDPENTRNEDGVDPVFTRYIHADVITERAGSAVAMNSTNERLRNHELLQNVIDEAVRNPNRSQAGSVRHDASVDISKEEEENISGVLRGVPYYEKPVRGHYIRHEGEILNVDITALANSTAT